MIRLAVVILHAAWNPQRRAMHAQLVASLRPPPGVTVDTLNDPYAKPVAQRHVHTCNLDKRAYMLALRRNPTHVLHLEDDSLPCRNLIKGVLRMLEDGPVAHEIVTLAGGRKTHAAACLNGARWFRSPDAIQSIGLVMPADITRDFLAWDAANIAADYPYYDGRIALYAFAHQRWIWTTCPSLVGHNDREPSLLDHHASPGRQMNFFDPAFDATSCDWAGGLIVGGPAAPSLYRDLRASVVGGQAIIDAHR